MPEENAPVLVTGAAGKVGSIGRRVVELLRNSGVPVRALVRQDDERADRLRDLGAEIVVADLTKSEQVFPALQGCRKVFFCTSVSPQYLEATMVMAAAAKASTGIEIILNISQMTVAEMDVMHVTESPQHRLQWLSELALDYSGLPVTHLRPTVFQENPLFWHLAAAQIEKSGTIRLPFGRGRSSPIAANDVAEVSAQILLHPAEYIGKSIELTGPESVDMYENAKEYSAALGRPVQYVEVPLEAWTEEVLKKGGLPAHAYQHILAMAKLHADGRYDRQTSWTEKILGRPAARISSTITSRRSHFNAGSQLP